MAYIEEVPAASTRPVLDEYDVLWRGSAWARLSPTESRILAFFLAHPIRVASRRQLGSAGWPDGVPNERSVDSFIKSLRRRIAPLGLRIHTVRRHGYLFQIDPWPPTSAPASSPASSEI
jgi:DNA-binding response OmpR family regulator